MNTQLDNPPGPVISLLKEFQGSSEGSSLVRKCQKNSAITSLLAECNEESEISKILPDFEEKTVIISLLLDCRNTRRVHLLYEFLGCLEVLELLSIETVTKETINGCLSVCTRAPFRNSFLSSQFQEAREFLLHVVVRKLVDSGQFDEKTVALLKTSGQNREMILCISRVAGFRLEEKPYLQFVRMLKETLGISFEQCLEDALRHKGWASVCKLMKMCDVSRGLLQRVLAKAVECRQWVVIETCLQQGGDIATACAENGFDLDTRTGRCKRTVLQDAVDMCQDKTMVEKLLQAGADPFAESGDTFGYGAKSVGMQAISNEDWDRVTSLLKSCRAPVDIASNWLLRILCERGQADILQMLLKMGADPLVTDDSGNTLMMTTVAAVDSRDGTFYRPSKPGSVEMKENVIRVLIQAGVSTHQALVSQVKLSALQEVNSQPVAEDDFAANDEEEEEEEEDDFIKDMIMLTRLYDAHSWSPFCLAVVKGRLRTAKMLYAAGACCNGEIHKLGASENIRERMEETMRREILDFLEDISSHPRSLADSCTLRISHLIGCGPQRDVRAASLGLPEALRRRVLHGHVINPDFLKNCPPHQRDCHVHKKHRFLTCGHGLIELYCFIKESYKEDYEEKAPSCSCKEVEDA
ncbi:uncharacterized protein [Littorina saxatilis]|uniref:uncharacterized protein n=1 Tax=Littorina saxatilis TaxID=31220 RepID=UPI0038B56CCB